MKEGIETQKIYSISLCRMFPKKVFVYGDNLIGIGKGGQAIIRDEPNAFGIPTKRLPTMEQHAFFDGNPLEKAIVMGRLFTLFYRHKLGITLVFPEDGLGTGLANLKENAPKIYNLIDRFLKTNFELEIMP